MVIKSIKIKNQSYYYWNDIIFIDDFDIKFFKISKRESRIGVDIYYIGYVVNKLEYDINSVKPLYLSVKSLLGSVEKIDGSIDRYLVIDKSNIEVINVFNIIREYTEDKIILNKIDGFVKIRFSSDIDLPLKTLIEIYLDECLYDRV